MILIDQLHYLAEDELRGLIVALHRIAQKGLPMILFGAGLPQLAAMAGEAPASRQRRWPRLCGSPRATPISCRSGANTLGTRPTGQR